MNGERERKALSWGIGAGAVAGIATAITLPKVTCGNGSSLSCSEQPNYQAGAIIGLAAALLAAIAVHR